jgi:LuxR family maltose regulon positive regulatory protein
VLEVPIASHSPTLAPAKIRLPRPRTGLIERTGLDRRLAEALGRNSLVLLVAPAGYGKTVTLSRQLQRLSPDCAVAWVTADEEDDLSRLLSCLIESLEPYDLPWRISPEALAGLAAQEDGPRSAARMLLDTLAVTDVERGCIALDDLHAVSDARVFAFLDALLEGLPHNWTLVIATRTDPPLGLGRLRVRRELTEFRQGALGFSMAEVRSLWQIATGADDQQAAHDLYQRTEGWPAGVWLSVEATGARGGLDPKGRRQTKRHLFDYLASEVLEQMPNELREFLLRCSVLPELTAGRCAAVSGSQRTAELLEDIERRGLFVSALQGEEPILRMHDLFRDFLDEKLRQQFPDEVPQLLRRAAESERDPVRRVNFLMRAGEWPEAEQVLAELAPALLTAGDSAQAVRLIEQFPQHRRDASPELAYARGLCAWQELEDPAVVKWMGQAAQGLERLGRTGQAQEARILEAISLLFMGRLDEATARAQSVPSESATRETAVLVELFAHWRSAIYGPPTGPACHLDLMADLLADDAPAHLWHRCMPAIYVMVGRPGIAGPMQRVVRGATLAARDGTEPLRAAADVLDTWLLLWRGDCEAAHVAIERLKEQSRWLGQPRSLRLPLMRAMVVFHALRGDREGLSAGFEILLSDKFTSLDHPDWRMNLVAWCGRLSAACGDWQGVRQALDDLKGFNSTTAYPRLCIRSLEARYALHEQRNEEAREILRSVAETSGDVDRLGLDAFVRGSLALAELRTGSPSRAWSALVPLIEAAAAESHVGGALLCGPKMLEELAQGQWGDSPATAEGVAVLGALSELAQQWRADAPDARVTVAGTDGPLSAREFEVLQCLAAGQSNKLIARALDLSPHTVKRHVARILDRLDLSSRGEAAAWYQKNTRR